MEDFKGTKKEWYIGEHRQTGIQIGCYQSHYVACAYAGGTDRSGDETLANAQLIACAPELMQALQDIINKIREYGYAGHFSPQLHYADITINKALGKEDENV